MIERLLQFIWQFQYFNKSPLSTSAGESLQIISPGRNNFNQGPDFADAKIKIGPTTWAGNIELHFKTSDWKKHNHHKDPHYNNVILHVVWEDDDSTPGSLPVLQLKEKVPKILLQRFEELMNATGFIACEKMIYTTRDLTWKSWKDRLLAERLLRKAKTIENYLQKCRYHWEEAFWRLLARNFGMKVNAELFEEIAGSVPVNLLAKHKNQVHQLEALLLGQANLLHEEAEEDYPKMLSREYAFYKKKYALRSCHNPAFFLRMRPGNFPSVRLAQLAMLIHESAHLFSKIREAESVKKVKTWFDITANDYWHYHYRFDEISPFKRKRLGDAMIDNIIINTIVPMLFAYGDYHGEERYKQKALQWLEETGAENNSITRGFRQLNIENKNAFDSQALIELKNEYCNKKRCLECAVGNSILKR